MSEWLCSYRSVVIASVLALGLAAGCTTDRHPGIPADAVMAVEGNGQLSYRAPSDGMVYIWDTRDNELIYSGEVRRDQLVVVDSDNDKITIGDKIASERDLRRDHRIRVFFDEGPRTVRKEVTVERETRIRRD